MRLDVGLAIVLSGDVRDVHAELHVAAAVLLPCGGWLAMLGVGKREQVNRLRHCMLWCAYWVGAQPLLSLPVPERNKDCCRVLAKAWPPGKGRPQWLAVASEPPQPVVLTALVVVCIHMAIPMDYKLNCHDSLFEQSSSAACRGWDSHADVGFHQRDEHGRLQPRARHHQPLCFCESPR